MGFNGLEGVGDVVEFAVDARLLDYCGCCCCYCCFGRHRRHGRRVCGWRGRWGESAGDVGADAGLRAGGGGGAEQGAGADAGAVAISVAVMVGVKVGGGGEAAEGGGFVRVGGGLGICVCGFSSGSGSPRWRKTFSPLRWAYGVEKAVFCGRGHGLASEIGGVAVTVVPAELQTLEIPEEDVTVCIGEGENWMGGWVGWGRGEEREADVKGVGVGAGEAEEEVQWRVLRRGWDECGAGVAEGVGFGSH